ncbi:MAG TPA: ATP-dependent DNA ligase [Terriglobales bacterium]|nr:ATP-dependent DNA ligase [Terriglobales bacterium]
MKRLAQTCEHVAATAKKLTKIAIMADYFQTTTVEEAAVATLFLSGRPFPAWEEARLQVGGALLWRLLRELSGKTEQELSAAYRRLGDLGRVAEEVVPAQEGRKSAPAFGHEQSGRPGAPQETDTRELTAIEVQNRFRQIAAAHGTAAKAALVKELLSQATPGEAKYIVKIITGDLRIGVKESLVEEAVAKAYGSSLQEVERANMLLGDLGRTLELAARGKVSEARMRLFHPLGFMLASPAASPEEALGYFANPWVEDKYDGIRAQAHCLSPEVRLFSRTRDDISKSFPDLLDRLAALPQDAILDGEIVAWSSSAAGPDEPGRALPFSVLQQRLGRKAVSEPLMRDVPVAYLVFDVLYAGGELLIDRSLPERGRILDALLAAEGIPPPTRPLAPQLVLALDPVEPRSLARVRRSPVVRASSPEELERLFAAAQARGNEGLMIKSPDSRYTPGRRGKSWLKLKRELATLDAVVTAVEYGHGKRIGVLSDYTFAVWREDELVNVGKAYSGLSDAEIASMTQWFLEHTLEDQGFRRLVEPQIVLEVAFNNVMRSDRHTSGYALRFPRIVRLRPDKPAAEADTLERVNEIYEKQSGN